MIQPCHDFVLVLKMEKSAMKSEGGIYIPINNVTGACQGKVRAVGPGIERDDGSHFQLPCAVEDTVIFRENSGESVMFGGETYLLVPAMEILAVVR